ncbi:MPBQ/MSBQ methyltransferase [Marchantia polymorpha subsp. ruderalis]|uniref:MPBQ/MBSQ family SAM-binding methyltransferase profile domain-containing protein n=2 Tax=Marchantia polymorpha TaxID=3197 RepID=A0A176WL72_MARPO|nr:hypothetical protein AXG93_2852s1000 [Marchantia polymorpha subsp. ruderalis]PTQ49156.1 hypothetical protein MARPO_0003s0058 [Marchantia polymorpha]BBN16915.1 hypothetical protein Mp_7g10390 [Marchantia polymorpha subsp. ruderalis]|eukprot:PTQ49156.1 hypothetical protein MARPO_0003s0058 [Marchantia polymorpha]
MASAVVAFHGQQLAGLKANRTARVESMRSAALSCAAAPVGLPSLKSGVRMSSEWMSGGAALNLLSTSRGAALRMSDKRRVGGKTLGVRCSASGSSTARPASQPRFIQHKQEAFWFYRFLSIVYDHVINPGHWTEDMREDALEPADLNDPNLVVVDVGGGTGFTTLGIVKTVDAKNVTILDQSPHQLAKAKEKEPLKECTIVEGDAEDLPFATDYADRYVSAGSIEYWPDPQRGIKEAYRVIKPGGKACLIGPVHPTHWLSRFFADVWMLFPTEEEYMDWFTKAGFSDVKIKRIGPKWYRGVRRHGLIMGCSVTGVKTEAGDSPLQMGPKAEDTRAPSNPFVFAYRFLIGTIASMYYVLVPIYMWLKDLVTPKGQPI